MRRFLRSLLRIAPWVVAAMAMVHPLARLGARWSRVLDLLTHFQEPALVLTVLAAVLLVRRSRRIAIALLVLAVFQLEPLYRYHLPDRPRPIASSAPALRILLANVLVDNHDYASLENLIQRTRPDVVALVEYSEEWAEGMRHLASEFPYRIEEPRGFRGLALWFRNPPRGVAPAQQPTADGWPYLHATIDFAGEVRHLWLLHPATPFRRSADDLQFAEFGEIARRVRDVGGSSIVMGDMNITDGSPFFADFLEKAHLKDSRMGFGRQRTWPVGSPYRIAIDHILITKDWSVRDRHVETPIGSDHFPLLIDLVPEAPIASSASRTSR